MKACSNCKTPQSIDARFCSSCGTAQPNELFCVVCEYPNESNSKFCQECSQPFYSNNKTTFNSPKPAQTPKISTILDSIPPPASSGIAIEFPFSSSQSFDFAVAEARKFASYEQFGEGKKVLHRVTIAVTEVESLGPLAGHMKGWRNRFVYVDGERVPWDTVFAHVWCYESKLASYKPEFYCFGYENEWEINPWGCTQARLPFRESSDWFTWGKWLDGNGTWKFDKERIRHELEKNMFPFRFCPAMSTNLTEAVLAVLPDQVNPNTNSSWKFVEGWEDDGRPAIRRIKRDEWGEEVTYLVGVEPNGRKALEDIAKAVGFRLG